MATWNPRANEIFASILELPPSQWQAALEQGCAGDEELLQQVDALLTAHAKAGSFLPRSVNPADVETVAPDANGVDPLLGIVRYVGDYELLAELGRGGMGVVYKARQASLRRLVALKMILAGGHAGPAQLVRFRTECEAIARLQHPNIVQVHEVGEHEGMPFFSLEFCPGGSLDKKVNGTPWLPLEAARLVETLARAMHVAHENNVVHRDLKPANVLLGADATPKITDFGLAKKLDEVGQTGSGDIMGTPSYMAPEQAGGNGSPIGPACDIYALGAILYEVLTGRPPFKAATHLDTILQVVSAEPVAPRQLQPKVPVDLETVCLKCLEKEPARRYSSARELAEDLARFQRGEPVRARPVGSLERGVKWVRRNPVTAALMATVALTLLLGATISAYFGVEARTQAKDAIAARKNAENEKREADAAKARAEDQLERTELAMYAGQLAQAQREWQDDNAGRALEILENCQSKLQNVEHHYLWKRWNSQQTLRGHTRPVTSVAFSPNGKRILTGSRDGTAKVWDAEKGQEIFSLKGHTQSVSSVAFSPDGQRILTGTNDGGEPGKPGEVIVWDAENGKEILSLKGHTQPVTCVAFSPDGKRILTGSGGRDEFFNPVPGDVKGWDAETGKQLLSLQGHTDLVTSVAFSPDGNRILSGSADETAKVWNVQNGQKVFSLNRHTQPVISVAFSPDRTRIVTGSADKTIKVWNADTGQELLTIEANSGQVTSVAFSPDGRCIVSGGMEFARPGQVKVWDTYNGQEFLSFKHISGVSGVGFSPDGTRILSGGEDGTARVWDARQALGSSLTSDVTSGRVSSAALSPDGKRIVTADGQQRLPGKVKLWDTESGQELLALPGHTGRVYTVAFSMDGKRILTGGSDGTVKVWHSENGQELLALKGGTGPVAFSPDGMRIVSGSLDKAVKVWDAENGQELLSVQHTLGVIHVAFSPDGKRIAASGWENEQPGEVKVWDAENGQELLSLKGATGHLAFSPDGTRLLTGSRDGIKMLDADKGVELYSFKDEDNRFAFSPDGKRFFAEGREGLKVWDTQKGLELLVLKGVKYPLAFSPDRKHFLTDMKVFDTEEGRHNPWPLLDQVQRQLYHGQQATLAEKEKHHFAAAFHLARLLLDKPDDADLKRRQAQALKAHAAQSGKMPAD